MEKLDLINEEEDLALRHEVDTELKEAAKLADQAGPIPTDWMFEDVFDEPPIIPDLVVGLRIFQV